MCTLMAGLAALGGYTQYRQQKQQADAQADAYNAQAQIAQQNARVESRKQEQIADNYAQQSKQLRARQRLSEGAQRAQTGAAGLDFSGSATDILSSGLTAYDTDQNNLLSNQRNDNYASRVAQSNFTNQANSYNAAASNIKSNAKMSGIGTILGTAASIYGLNQSWKNGASASTTAGNDYTIGGTNNLLNAGYTLTTPQIGVQKNKYGYAATNKLGYISGW